MWVGLLRDQRVRSASPGPCGPTRHLPCFANSLNACSTQSAASSSLAGSLRISARSSRTSPWSLIASVPATISSCLETESLPLRGSRPGQELRSRPSPCVLSVDVVASRTASGQGRSSRPPPRRGPHVQGICELGRHRRKSCLVVDPLERLAAFAERTLRRGGVAGKQLDLAEYSARCCLRVRTSHRSPRTCCRLVEEATSFVEATRPGPPALP